MRYKAREAGFIGRRVKAGEVFDFDGDIPWADPLGPKPEPEELAVPPDAPAPAPEPEPVVLPPEPEPEPEPEIIDAPAPAPKTGKAPHRSKKAAEDADDEI